MGASFEKGIEIYMVYASTSYWRWIPYPAVFVEQRQGFRLHVGNGNTAYIFHSVSGHTRSYETRQGRCLTSFSCKTIYK